VIEVVDCAIISGEEGTSENNRRAKFYKLTKGRRQLAEDLKQDIRHHIAIETQ